jgi:hypothetical protein
MALIFEFSCQRCQKKAFEVSDYMTVLHDGKEVNLPHPCEDDELKNLGLTREKAALRGRLFLYEGRICQSCGSITYLKSLILPFGCEPSRIESAIWVFCGLIICGSAIYWNMSTLLAGTIIGAFLLLLMVIRPIIIRRWVRRKFGFSTSNVCDHCGSKQLSRINHYLLNNSQARFYCGDCGKREMICTHESIS